MSCDPAGGDGSDIEQQRFQEPRPSEDRGAGSGKARRRGTRRATGGSTVSQGEPQGLAGFSEPAQGSGLDGQESEDERGRWLREQRPPHWD